MPFFFININKRVGLIRFICRLWIEPTTALLVLRLSLERACSVTADHPTSLPILYSSLGADCRQKENSFSVKLSFTSAPAPFFSILGSYSTARFGHVTFSQCSWWLLLCFHTAFSILPTVPKLVTSLFPFTYSDTRSTSLNQALCWAVEWICEYGHTACSLEPSLSWVPPWAVQTIMGNGVARRDPIVEWRNSERMLTRGNIWAQKTSRRSSHIGMCFTWALLKIQIPGFCHQIYKVWFWFVKCGAGFINLHL